MELIREFTEEYSDYLHDESRTMGHAESIAFPKNEQELVEIVRYCATHKTPVNVQGGLTGLAGGASPQGGLALNLSRMNKILGMRYDEAANRFFVRVQPGVLLSQLRKALENKAFDIQGWSQDSIDALSRIKAGQLFFSPDPTEPTASIGGMAACNASGARSFLYGATRRHVQALRVVLADGSLSELRRGTHRAVGRDIVLPLEGGGERRLRMPDFATPAVKDAGYYFHDDMDTVDLFMGSQGTLAIISELELALIDAPKLMWGATAFMPSDEAALTYVRLLRGEKLPGLPVFEHKPASLEFFNKHALTMILKQKEITPAFAQLQELPADYCSAVYVEFNDADSESFAPVLRELRNVVEAVGGDPDKTWVAKGTRELEKLLFFRHTVPETIDLIVEQNKKNEPCITLLSTDMAVSDQYMEKLFAIYRGDLEQTDLHWVIFGHVGENHFHPNILARTKDEYEQGHRIFEKWAKDVHDMNGSISAEHGAGKIKTRLARIMYGEENLQKIKEFKRQLDPDFILGPGNILS
ncbi:MAG: FAD-binding oxidoreductase [Bacillota bacterium]|nr:FAD-binding oxidoreductase [Bacillota bacterium]